jgi:signal recognition particle subunit SRP54
MLEKLGQAIKKGIDKIAGAIFVDKKVIEEVVKELQRALIESDVNVSLVKEISDKIRKVAESEKIKGVEKREQIIKILHDELIEILGKEKLELEFKKGKSQKVLLLGLYGSGKCVHGTSNIQLSNGNIIKIKDIYSGYKDKLSEEMLEDGTIINISNKNLFVPSFNPRTLKIENKKATHLWKLNKDKLIEVKLDNGNDYSIKVTPEHPFFVMREGKVIQSRADEIKESDFIAIPREIDVVGSKISLADKIRHINLIVHLKNEEVKKMLSQKNATIKDVCKNLKNKRNYCCLTSDLKEGNLPIELLDLENFNFINTKHLGSKKFITLPLYLTYEFSEFLGYLIGDGHIGKNYVEIVSQDSEVINRIKELSKILFNITANIKKDKRTKNMFRIQMNSKTLVEILKIFGLNPGSKGKELKMPEEILKSDTETIRHFVRAYFDCDSHAVKDKRYIELSSESHILIKQMNLLLNRFGIVSIISKKIINNIPYWRLSIKARYAEIYAEKIGYLIGYKKRNVERYKQIGSLEGCGNQDMIPLGRVLKDLRINNGFSIGEIQTNAVYSYGRYEEKGLISREKLTRLVEYYKSIKKGVFLNLLENIYNKVKLNEKYSNSFLNGTLSYLKDTGITEIKNNNLILSNNGILFLQKIKSEDSSQLISYFENLANSNVCWVPVKEISNITNDEGVVYDLTIEDNHSFIAEGFIVHNTTTTAKLANYYNKRGFKTAMLGLDVHRPAAMQQLEQLGKQHSLAAFIDKKEKNPSKVYKKFEKELKGYDIVFIDTAGRHTLDKELVKEIKTIKKDTKPTYILLVIPADIGQAAKKQAKEFQEACNIDGVIVTRMDSTARGGGALTACNETKAKVIFITTGEKINDIEVFNPSSFVSRILGMGDLEALIEKVRSVTDEKALARVREGKFTMYEMKEQIDAMGKMGSFSKILDMIPGIGGLLGSAKAKIPEEMLENQGEKAKKWKFIIDSMTPEEKENPELIEKQTTRIQRLAKGSGTSATDVRSLLKQYKILKEFVKAQTTELSEKQLMKFAKKFGKKVRLR